MKSRLRRKYLIQKGFSLLELLIVVVLLAIVGFTLASALAVGKRNVQMVAAQGRAYRSAETLAQKFAQDKLIDPRDGTIYVTTSDVVIDPQQPVPDARKFTYHAQTKRLNNGVAYVTVVVDGENHWSVVTGGRYTFDVPDTGDGGGGK